MTRTDLPIRPEDWMRRIFLTRAAAEGGVVRRKTSDIDRIIGRERFVAELDRRGFRAVENGGQTVIFCNRDPVVPLRRTLPHRRQIPPEAFANPL